MISYNFKVIITIDIYKINLNAFLDDYGRKTCYTLIGNRKRTWNWNNEI